MFRTNQGRGSNGHGVALFSGSLVAESANATNLQITTQPGLSGATPYTLSPQPVVTAKKSLGTTDSAYVTNVVASLNVLSGSPVLSGTTTKTPVSGVATFTDLVVTGAGTWTITFTSGTLASAVSSTGTTTSSSAATKLTITTAPGLSGSTPYTLSPQPVVAAQTAGGVTDTGYVTNVVAALNVLTGSPVLSGTTTKACVSGVATFTDLVVTGAGTWTITFSSGTLASATSSTGTTTASGGGSQFSDDFSSNTISAGSWDTTLTGSGAASAATGALVVSTGTADGVSKVTMHTAASLTTAGAAGVQFKWTTLTASGITYQVHLVDASGNGWGFQRIASGGEGTVAANAYTNVFGITLANGDLLRFVKSGTNVLLDRSTDGGTNWTNQWTTAIGSVDVTAMKLRFQADNTGSGQAGSATFDDVVFA